MAILTLTPTTELDAINLMLRYTGNRPVNAVSDGVSPSQIAQRILHETSREVQSNGLNCNRTTKYTLTANTDSEFVLPQGTLVVDPVDKTKHYVEKNGKLFDPSKNTSVFTETTLDVDIIMFLSFEALPEPVRRYIALEATGEMIMTELRRPELLSMIESKLFKAAAAFRRHELKVRDGNMLSSIDVASVASRDFNAPRAGS